MNIYTIGQAAKYLGISIDYMRRLLTKGKVKGFRVGDSKYSHWRIREDELLKYTKR